VVGSLGSDLVAGLGPAAEDVALTDCQLEDRDLWRLAGLPALRALDVSNNPRLTFGGVVAFGISPNLTKLSLRWTKLQASALSALLLLPALEELDVSANLWVSEECGPLSSPRLESLNISSCFLEDDDAWEMLGPRANLPALERLDVSDNYLGGLSFARGLGALTSLDARGNLVDPAHARRTLRGLDKLSALDLRGNVS
jgi:Leucine-rich repeat (LRR) protein